MSLLKKIERKLQPYAVPHTTLIIIFGQALVFMLSLNDETRVFKKLILLPSKVMEGEVFRLFSFIFIPPTTNIFFLFFAFYFFFIMGTGLDRYWGTLRYNFFLLIGYIATVAVSFLSPQTPASVAFLGGSVFLAFATLNPNFQILLMFILPIRIKWLALIMWIGYILGLAFGGTGTRLLILASILNYLVFFHRHIINRMRSGHRKMQQTASELANQNKTVHECIICGKTEKSHPDMMFRYCSKCAGAPCYCEEHLPGHEHIENE